MKPARLFRLAVVALALGAVGAVAAPAAPPALPAPSLSLGGLLQMLFGLAVVLGTVAGAAWLLKRLAPGQTAAGGSLRLIGAIAVGPKERVVVVEIGDSWLVLGVAPGQVNALHHLARLETRTEGATGGAPERSFAVWLSETMKRRNGAGQ